MLNRKCMNRILAAALSGVLAFSLAACGSSSSSSDTSDTTSEETAEETTEEETTEEEETEEEAAEETAEETEEESSDDSSSTLTNAVPGLSSSYANSATVKHDSVTVIESGDPGNLLPQDTSTTGKNILDSIFEYLYVIDGFGGDLLPAIAESDPVAQGYDEESGYYIYDITIRDNVYDTDGNNLTAADVAYSYEWLVNNSTPQNMGKYHYSEAVDTYVVRFYCDELDGVSDYSNLFCRQWLFTEQAFNDHDFSTDPIGTGPYVVTEYVSGSSCTMTAKDDYWAEGEDYQLAQYCANVEEIVWLFLGESSQHANMLKTGEGDASHVISETDLPDFLNDGEYADEYNAYQYQENLTYYLLPNCSESSVCSDLNLRMAIMYAVDSATVALASGNSSAEAVYDLYNNKFPEVKESWKTEEDNFYTNASMETAAEYLAASDYNGETIVLVTSDAPAACQNVATVVATLLQSLGLDVELQVLSSSIFNDSVLDETSWDLCISMMASSDYGVVMVARLMAEENFGDGQQTKNFITDDYLQELISLVNTIDGHTDENVQELHDYLIDNAYGRGLFCTTSYVVVTNEVEELALNFQFRMMPGGCIYVDNEF